MSPLQTTSRITFRNILFYSGVLLGIILFITYIAFQARFILEGPQITLSGDRNTPQTTRTVYLEGTAQNIVRMSLNGRQIYTDTSGNFKEALVLENGYTIATLHAEDRYGRTTNLTREFVYLHEAEKTIN